MRNPSNRSIDPLVVLVVALVGFAGALALAEPGGRPPELLVAGAAAIGAYAARRVHPAAVWAAAAAAYLLLELAQDRLDPDRYWAHIAAGGLLAGIVAAATAAARRRDAIAAARRRAATDEEERRAADEIALLLAGGGAPDEIEREVVRARRHERAAGVLLIRPDDDTEDALRAVAAAAGAHLRTSDVAFPHARSICVLLPETEPAGARAAGERLRLALVAAGAPNVSIGAASFPEAASRDDLLERAEDALARARELGGNRTVASFLPAETPPAWRVGNDAPSSRVRESTST